MAAADGPAAGAAQVPGEDGRPDAGVAHIARVYNYWLGGADHFPADREAAKAAIAAYPGIQLSAQANRAFLARAVRHLAGAEGIRQFLDIGTGLPTANNTHQVAQAVAPASRVVYVDNDRCKSGCAHAARGLLRNLLELRERLERWTGRGSWWLWCRRATR